MTFAREGMGIILLIVAFVVFYAVTYYAEKKYGSKGRGKGVKN